jgi:hypothetical protein
MKRIGQRVRILGGLLEFIGKTGEIVGKEGNLYRVYLDEPVDVAGIGRVRDDLWERSALKTLMPLVPTDTNDE